jgi:hypothetical protein
MLFEELSETFPAEVVEPYGEVLIVPVKAFKPASPFRLEAEGVQIYTNAYRGQVCFFLRKKASNQAAQGQPQPNVGITMPTSSQPQNIEDIEDAVAQLVKQGLGFKEIQQRLVLTSERLMGVFSSLSRKGVLQKLGWVPMRKRLRKPSSNLPVQIRGDGKHAKPNLNASSLPVREMLQASLKILDEHPKVAKFLLQKCVEALT